MHIIKSSRNNIDDRLVIFSPNRRVENGDSIKLRTKELIKTYRRPFQRPSLPLRSMDARARVKTFSVSLPLSLPPPLFLPIRKIGNRKRLSTYPMIFQIFFSFRWIDGKKKGVGKKRNEEKSVAEFSTAITLARGYNKRIRSDQ